MSYAARSDETEKGESARKQEASAAQRNARCFLKPQTGVKVPFSPIILRGCEPLVAIASRKKRLKETVSLGARLTQKSKRELTVVVRELKK